MKIVVTLKDPDGVYDSIRDAVESSIREMSLNADEKKVLISSRQKSCERILEKWIEYGEYVRIEFDTEAGTAIVLPVK